MRRDRARELQSSWIANAEGWARAVRERRIPSRRFATDAAMVAAILERSPGRVADVGCGEGWLARALAERGVEVVGADASAPLVEAARAAGGGTFHLLSYAQVAAAPEALGTDFDAAVFNFALLDEEAAPVLQAVRKVLTRSGALLVQTVHPWTARDGQPYRDGWRTETFAAFGDAFVEPMPWYFRTLQSWTTLLHGCGYRIAELREPAHPDSGEPLSLLVIAEPAP